MHRAPIAAVVWLASLMSAAPEALALATIDITWIATSGAGSTGSSVIEAEPGDQLTAEILMSVDAAGVSSYSLSLRFDSDLQDELDLISATEHLPTGFDVNFTPGVFATLESTGTSGGSVLSFEAATLGEGPAETTFSIGEVVFAVSSRGRADGADVFAGPFNVGIDGFFDNSGAPMEVTFGSAAVDVPEPSVLLLVTIALIFRMLLHRPACPIPEGC